MKIDIEEKKVNVFTPFEFKITVESEEEAVWLHDYIICDIPGYQDNHKFKKEHQLLIGSFYKQICKSKGQQV